MRPASLVVAVLAALTLFHGCNRPAYADTLGPGAIKTPGVACATTIQPPEYQGCPQRSDADCQGTPRQIGECMAARRGWFDGPDTGNQWSCLDQIITAESGWDPTAGHPSGSYGLPQSLPGDKMATAGSDWLTDPVTQLRWLDDTYIPERYGDPCAALVFRAWHGWY